MPERIEQESHKVVGGRAGANWGECYLTAFRAGRTMFDAEDCENGDLLCPKCPWRLDEHQIPEG